MCARVLCGYVALWLCVCVWLCVWLCVRQNARAHRALKEKMRRLAAEAEGQPAGAADGGSAPPVRDDGGRGGNGERPFGAGRPSNLARVKAEREAKKARELAEVCSDAVP